MRSRAARLTLSAVVLVALGAALFLTIRFEQQIASLRAAERQFDVRAREAVDALSDVRAEQAAYVAMGQGVEYWMPKVASTVERVSAAVTALQALAAGDDARRAIDTAAGTIADFVDADRRARDYLTRSQPLMAADVIFTESGETAAAAARNIEQARDFERQATDGAELARRRQQAIAIGSAAAAAALVGLLLVPIPRPTRQPEAAARQALQESTAVPAEPDIPLHQPEMPVSGYMTARPAGPVLRAAAALCTDLGRVSDLEELKALLGRASDVMDASGVVVWLATAAGSELQPALSHGYTPQVLARMPSIPRSADNAAAAAFRTGQLQLVLARPGSSNGAVVAPLLSSEGCIGALSAEIRGGGEASDSVQAMAAIFAAQLAAVLHAAPVPEAAAQPRSAQA